ncbi:MAG: hypothetical protein M3Y24_06425 [Acidobacteriota bacterium]|nr:hypothetical protein [Acidobacteriota bacterium]
MIGCTTNHSVLIGLALSIKIQVLFAIDGPGADQYRQLWLKGLVDPSGKDLAFLSLLGVLVLPLDFVSGFASGVAVLKAVSQTRWRFTSGTFLLTA